MGPTFAYFYQTVENAIFPNSNIKYFIVPNADAVNSRMKCLN